MPFFIADGIFNWNSSKIDDHSSYGIGQLAYHQNLTGGYNLPSDSPWRMDLSTIMELITYQTDTSKVVAPTGVNAYVTSAHAINDADKNY